MIFPRVNALPVRSCRAEGWREGEVSSAHSEASTMEVRSDRTPQPGGREFS